MLSICDGIDRVVRWLATVAASLIVVVALTQVIASILRYFYSYAPIMLQELIPSLNVILVGISICYAVLRDVHTRVDILTAHLGDAAHVRVELVLVICLLCPATFLLLYMFIPYVAQSWASLEGSRNVGGLGGAYIVKSFLLVMSAILLMQAASIVVRLLVLRRWPYPDAGVAEL